jgi:alanine-glyoxylate transaminase/serine-glyoxylate transaminase/serine-pyruvate transaminase
MSLNFGRLQLAIPGPSIIPDRVLAAMHKPSPNIYYGPLVDMVDTLYPDLKTVAQTRHDMAIYIANGHGAWEAALKNTLIEGDKVLILGTGRFPLTWAEMAQSHGIKTEIIQFGMHDDADVAKVREALSADTKGEIRAVLAVQTDTASSVKNDIPAIRKAIDETGHNALYMVDCIASLGCDEYHMDEWGVDVTITACQKGLMTPAGIAFVYFNDKAKEARKRAKPGEYWDWVLRTQSDIFYRQFDGTAPTQHLYGIREALDILVHEEGMKACWKRHETQAKAVWAALDGWGTLQPNIADPEKRSTAVTTVKTAPGQATAIREWCEQSAGLVLGIPLGFEGKDADRYFRIGHMGHLNPPMLLGALTTIETAMKALKIKHDEGAISAACQVLANHKSD